VWHPRQLELVEVNFSPSWQEAQSTVLWRPINGNPVMVWSNPGSLFISHESVAWQV
jgi:hypothetical protein